MPYERPRHCRRPSISSTSSSSLGVSAYRRNPKRSRPLENRRSTPYLRGRNTETSTRDPYHSRVSISVCSPPCEERLGILLCSQVIRYPFLDWRGTEPFIDLIKVSRRCCYVVIPLYFLQHSPST